MLTIMTYFGVPPGICRIEYNMRGSVGLGSVSARPGRRSCYPILRMLPRTRLALPLLALAAIVTASAQAPGKTQNVIVVMSDGLRWQEAFSGADPALMNKQSGVTDLLALRQAFWRDTPSARREALMPFLWTVVARQGQIYGNRELGSDAFVTNGRNFSYPGYSETFCGFPDDRIDSNDKNDNPNVSVLEWLARKPAYTGRIAAFGAWELFPYILNVRRSGLMVNAGYDPLPGPPTNSRIELLNRLKRETGIWGGESMDAPTFHTALEYVKLRKPRVLFLSLGETDEWAHAGQYELYLKAAQRVDRYVQELWETLQAMPEYKGNTSLILAVDHGRGMAPLAWKDHGEKTPDSKYVWMAFLGPDTPALGERSRIAPVTQNQIAATLAALLGEDYTAPVPKAGQPIPDAIRR